MGGGASDHQISELVHLETASEELTDEFLLFAIESGLSKTWATEFPDPRVESAIAMEVILPAHFAGRFAGLYSLRKTDDVVRKLLVKMEQEVTLSQPAPTFAKEPIVAVKVRERASRRAVAFEQLRTQRTHIIVYTGDYFELFETLSLVQMVLQLEPPIQEKLRVWLAEHLKQIQKRE
jgi:hypothetical protein